MRILGCQGRAASVEEPAEVVRPSRIEPGAWRRFSRLARLTATVLDPVLSLVEAPGEIPMFFGTGLGEYTSSYTFLRSVYGTGAPSPLAFQNSVHNAAAGHLSIAFGLRGHAETLCGGPDTTALVFMRVQAWLDQHGGQALIVLGDDCGPEAIEGWRAGGEQRPLGEGAAAFWVAAGAEELPMAEPLPWFFCTAPGVALAVRR